MKKVVLLTIGCILAILIAEIMLRLFFTREEVGGDYWGIGAFISSETLGYRHAPGFQGRAYRKGQFDCPVEISPSGLRQKNLGTQIAQPRRVLLLGDSFTFGLGVKETSSFAALMQPKLNAMGIGVINGAQTGYCVEQEVKFGHELLVKYNPNAVLLCLYPDNDVEGDYLKDYKNVDVRYGYRVRKDRLLRGTVIDFLRTHSYVWLFTEDLIETRRAKRIRSAFRKQAKQNPLQVMGSTFDALAELERECRSRNIRMMVVLIPSGNKGKLFVQPLRNKFESISVPFLDLNEKDFIQSDVFVLDGHWNENGHRKAARYIGAFIETQLH